MSRCALGCVPKGALNFFLIIISILMVSAASEAAENSPHTFNSPEDSVKVNTIKEIVVSGIQPLATRQILSGKELRSLSSTSVADAIKYFAGAQIKDYGGLGGLKTVNGRSMGAHGKTKKIMKE